MPKGRKHLFIDSPARRSEHRRSARVSQTNVQKATRAEIERFHNYGSAQEVMTNFRRDLDSEPAKRVHAELRSLDLPTLNDVRDEFERRAEELSVTGRLSSRMPIHSAHKLAILAQSWGVDGQHGFF